MNAVMYILLRSPDSLPMTTGKAAAQASHAAVEAYRLTDPDSNLHKDWYVANHYTKIVLQTDDLFVAKEYLTARGVKCALIIDEGRTEFDGGLTPTALGCTLVNKDNPHIQDTFAAFKLYTEKPKYAVLEVPPHMTREQVLSTRAFLDAGDLHQAKEYVKMCKPHERPRRDWTGFWKGKRG